MKAIAVYESLRGNTSPVARAMAGDMGAERRGGKEIMNTHHDSDKHHRRSLRLQAFDYAQEGAYFVTVCLKDRACLFGDISDGNMVLNDAGLIAEKCWHDIPTHFPHIELDEFVIMPNHVHGILSIITAVGANLVFALAIVVNRIRAITRIAPTGQRPGP